MQEGRRTQRRRDGVRSGWSEGGVEKWRVRGKRRVRVEVEVEGRKKKEGEGWSVRSLREGVVRVEW